MERPIGGYFELELSCNYSFPHKNGILLNSGRHALEHILRSLRVKRIWLPYFTCDVVLQPIQKLNIPYSFYHINNNLELCDEFQLDEGEYLIVTNYFGIKDSYISKLVSKYENRLIIDNAQALFAKSYSSCCQFYSPRKFVGIPDGGIAISYDSKLKKVTYPKDKSFDRCSHLLKRWDLLPSDGYSDFKNNSKQISDSELMVMSNLTNRLLSSIDFESVKKSRLQNFDYLHNHLLDSNKLTIPDISSFSCPMVYPYWTENLELRQTLINNNVFVAKYWPNVLEWCNSNDLETELTNNIIPLPIDQRYRKGDMDYIINLISEYE